MKEAKESVFLKIICLSGAIATSIWCCYEYHKNEDMCEVYFKRFTEDEDSIYPDLTLMLSHQLDESALQEAYGNKVNSSLFLQNLIGNRYDDSIQRVFIEKEIDISEVSKGLKDYLLLSCNVSPMDETCTPILNVSTVYASGGAFHSFHFPTNERVMHAKFRFNSSVLTTDDVLITFHYPKQLFRSQSAFSNIEFPSRENDDSKRYHQIQFKITHMESLRRRHKGKQDCLDLENYDGRKFDELFQGVGCRPFYFPSNKVHRICNTLDEVKRIERAQRILFYRLKPPENDVPPCREVTKLQIEQSMSYEDITNEEMSLYGTNVSWFEIKVDILTDTYKEIKQKRAYSQQSLVGNLGGYLGLLVGFTLLDLLSVMSLQFEKIKEFLASFLGNEKRRKTKFRKKNSNLIRK